MKIGIYAPAKNEIKHIESWYSSCKDADIICVADTGSIDGTKEALVNLGVKVTDIRIIPWRFDDAFNAAMYLLPEDVDVCIRLDMDERLQPGWREELERDWTPTTTRLRYEYIWNWNVDGTPGKKWWGDRIHSRKNYRWMGATHEGLYCRGEEVETFSNGVKIWQFPDAKDKKNDLPLLLESCREWPNDSRFVTYLAREYFYRKDYENATKTYNKFLSMNSNYIERGNAMLNLSICDPIRREEWLLKAAKEIPDHREPLVELSRLHYENSKWKECIKYAFEALNIVKHPLTYICSEDAWGYLPHDLLAVAFFNLKDIENSLKHAKLALSKKPNDVRLINNTAFIQNAYDKEVKL